MPAVLATDYHEAHQANPTSHEDSCKYASTCPVTRCNDRYLSTRRITVVFTSRRITGAVSASCRSDRGGLIEINHVGEKYVRGADFFFHSKPTIVF
jgi:hypothetical protein